MTLELLKDVYSFNTYNRTYTNYIIQYDSSQSSNKVKLTPIASLLRHPSRTITPLTIRVGVIACPFKQFCRRLELEFNFLPHGAECANIKARALDFNAHHHHHHHRAHNVRSHDASNIIHPRNTKNVIHAKLPGSLNGTRLHHAQSHVSRPQNIVQTTSKVTAKDATQSNACISLPLSKDYYIY